MTTPGSSHYGRCPCSGHYEERWVEVRMTVGDDLVVLPEVPQGACPVCGSRVYKAAVLAEVERTMRGGAALQSS